MNIKLSSIITGILVIIGFLTYYEIPFSKSDGGRLIGGTLAIILRASSCVWISQIAKSQGRKSLGFIISAIFIPAITLIIIGILGNKINARTEKA